MATTSPKNIIPGLDILKFIMAILIVSGHCSFLEEYPNLYNIWSELTGIAVPIFFAISSYLFFSKVFNTPVCKESNSLFFHYVKRLAILFAVWYLLMIPMTYCKFYSVATLKETIFAIFLSCCFNGYWFIKAMLINTMIVYVFRKHLIPCIIVSLLVFLFCSYNYIYNYNPFLNSHHPYYSFYYNTAYLCCGALFAKYKENLHFTKWNNHVLILIWVLLFVSSLFYYEADPILRLLSFPLLFPVFYNLIITPKPIHKTMRNISIILYMIQFVLIWLYDVGCQCFLDMDSGTFQLLQHSIMRFIIVLFFAIILSTLIIKQEERYKWLKLLH